MKDTLLAAVLAIVMTLNFFDVLTDISLGLPLWHVLQECSIVLASSIGFVYLMLERRRHAAEMKQLAHALASTDQQLASLNQEMKSARHAYSEVIQKQFSDWGLTRSEQQVAMLLLKGLSFREVASIRDTREKTVRQQASSLYAKSGIEGRHAFSAWFLEDLIAESSTDDLPVAGLASAQS